MNEFSLHEEEEDQNRQYRYKATGKKQCTVRESVLVAHIFEKRQIVIEV